MEPVNMDLDEMKLAWKELDRRIDRVENAMAQDQRTREIGRVRQGMVRFAGLPIWDILGALVVSGFLGSFLAHGPHELRWLGLAVSLFLVSTVILAVNVAQLALLCMVDFTRSVVEIQKRLGQVRALRLGYVQWSLILGPLLWLPVWMVFVRGMIGVDISRLVSHAWIAWNEGFGVLVVVVAIWASRRFKDRFSRSRYGKAVAASIAGRSLSQAISDLEAIRRFEAEN